MYSLGSVDAVGSWFCISVTSKVRKSLDVIVAEALLDVLVLLVPLVPLAGVAFAVALLLARLCSAAKF